MKAILEFNLPEEKEEFEMASNALNLSVALFDIQQEVFRPARKHGYIDEKLNMLLKNKKVAEAIDLLEQKMLDICKQHNVDRFI